VALAKVSQLVAAGEHVVLKERIADVSAVVLHIGVFATLQLWVWTPEIIGAWLGPEYRPGVGVVRIVVLSVSAVSALRDTAIRAGQRRRTGRERV
jgi:O-antigen/teichoic acid export membrane protein